MAVPASCEPPGNHKLANLGFSCPQTSQLTAISVAVVANQQDPLRFKEIDELSLGRDGQGSLGLAPTANFRCVDIRDPYFLTRPTADGEEKTVAVPDEQRRGAASARLADHRRYRNVPILRFCRSRPGCCYKSGDASCF